MSRRFLLLLIASSIGAATNNYMVTGLLFTVAFLALGVQWLTRNRLTLEVVERLLLAMQGVRGRNSDSKTIATRSAAGRFASAAREARRGPKASKTTCAHESWPACRTSCAPPRARPRAAVDPAGLAWHDRLSGTRLVRVDWRRAPG